MRYLIILFTLLTYPLAAGEVKVAVAANVTYAMEEIVKSFRQSHPDINVRTTLGSSGNLTAQIMRGAPYQLFLSANMRYPQRLYKEGFAITEPKIYAMGALALLSRKERDFSKGIASLRSPEIKRIAIANPKTAPYGKAALEALQKSGLYPALRPKLLYAQSVAQVLSYILTAVDVGFVAKSSLYSPKMRAFKEGLHWITVDPAYYSPIEQGVVMLKRAKGNPDAEAFYRFIFSDEVKKILKAYGYKVP